VSEALDLAWTARDSELFGRIVLARLFPSCRSRYEIREHLLASLRGKRQDNAMSLLVSRLNWNRNDGAQAHFKHEFKDLPPPAPGPHLQSDWACDPVNERYIHRFLKLAADHKIRVYWLIAPLCPTAQAHLEHRGDDDRYREFVEKTQAAYPNVVVIDGRRPGLDRTFFFDDRHLDRDGASALSAGIGEIITRRELAGADSPRWETLSHVDERPVAIAVEDVGKSLSDIRSFTSQRRR
jgi:hypothetical protein